MSKRTISPLRRLRTYVALGPANLARVAAYRLALRYGVHPVQRLRGTAPSGPVFARRPSDPPAGARAREEWRDTGLWFGAHPVDTPTAPDWHANPFTGARIDPDRAWFAIPDFDSAIGDIKAVWEASRLDWLLAMAQRAALGDMGELKRLNLWLQSWSLGNPPYRGANWKCAQEASIRVLHLAMAALLLDQVAQPMPDLIALLRLHLRRIAPTTGYAIGQQNNHGTSEAAALFVGGSWLEMLGDRAGARWSRLGRRMLEERARTLVAPDGSFSQYSLVYHRLMLDTYAFAESWRRRWDMPAFSERMSARMAAATLWLREVVDPYSGDGPNYGANDGARLLALTDAGHRDFRPSLQWASAVFLDSRAVVAAGPWDQPLIWVGIPKPVDALPLAPGGTFDDGGLHVLRRGQATAYLNYPRYRFRPSQCDALHLDLWVDGRNLLRDGGTYGYAASASDRQYFDGAAAHNSVQFDDRESMPRLGRFLLGEWLQAPSVRPAQIADRGIEASAAYTDWQGATHHRHVRLCDRTLVCTDRVGGQAMRALLRWRLHPGPWRLDGASLTDGRTALLIESDDPSMRVSLVEGWESRHYLEREALPVLEVAVRVPAVLSTRIDF